MWTRAILAAAAPMVWIPAVIPALPTTTRLFSDSHESYVSPYFTNRDSSSKLMSPTDKPTGEVTNAVDPDYFGGGSSTEVWVPRQVM